MSVVGGQKTLVDLIFVFKTKFWRLHVFEVSLRGERKSPLRQSLLVLRHPSVGVDEDELAAIETEGEGGFVTRNALVGEDLEDLFECGLRNAVLLDAQVAFLLLQPAE
jgi:hypothetical protein